MRRLPPIDAHAHLDARIDHTEIRRLGALVIAMTRSLDEGDLASRRHDEFAIWGVGCHPGLKKAQDGFDSSRFEELLARTAVAGELGLDGKSRVSMEQQLDTLSKALDILRRTPRLASLHSYAAIEELLEVLERGPSPGIILHWWLGDARQTQRAVESGCYFSVNASSSRRKDMLARIPPDRLLTETDHPFGDRQSRPQRPGNVDVVEAAIGSLHSMKSDEVRQLMWSNLRQLIVETGCSAVLPHGLRVALAAYS